jgi:hypothetical protein
MDKTAVIITWNIIVADVALGFLIVSSLLNNPTTDRLIVYGIVIISVLFSFVTNTINLILHYKNH